MLLGEAATVARAVPRLRWLPSGSETIELPGRRLRLDPDNWLLLDGREGAGVRSRGEEPALPVAVRFDEAMLEGLSGVSLLANHLRPQGGPVGRALARLAPARGAGADPEHAAAGFARLHSALQEEGAALAAGADRLEGVKASTRTELLRRLLLACDHMQSHYEQPMRLAEIAEAARLSRFHFVRQFVRWQGCTPHDYLLAKRLAVARRLLAAHGPRPDLAEVALRSGLGTRSSLYRHLHARRRGGVPRAPVLVEPCPTAA